MATEETPNNFHFQGFQFPTTTPVPDEVFDILLPQLTHAEIRVLLYIIRRTFGFKKERDNISLSQMVSGIKTKDGRVIDGGTGLAKSGAAKAIKGLVEKGVVLAQKNRSDERGNEPTTYALKFREDPLSTKWTRGVHGRGQALVHKMDIQQTVLQETEEQHDVVVGQTLQNFGISTSAAIKLAKDYPESHVLGKLELAQWLVSTGSPLVAKNPAGWLRKAIEEDYTLPRNYHSSRLQQAKEGREAKIAQAEARQRHVAEEEYRRVKAETKIQILEQYPPQPIGEEGLTTESVWDLTLKRLKEQVSAATYENWLKDTVLLQVTDQAAQIAVPSAFAVAWLERRMYGQICNAIKGVLGNDLDLQFVAAS